MKENVCLLAHVAVVFPAFSCVRLPCLEHACTLVYWHCGGNQCGMLSLEMHASEDYIIPSDCWGRLTAQWPTYCCSGTTGCRLPNIGSPHDGERCWGLTPPAVGRRRRSPNQVIRTPPQKPGSHRSALSPPMERHRSTPSAQKNGT